MTLKKDLNLKPLSSTFLSLEGLLLMATGIYFIVARPALLPEDLHFMKTSLSVINETLPGLNSWLGNVFCVMGGYIFTTGLLILYISVTSFRNRESGAFGIVALSFITSIGSMTFVNFMIGSDFKWILVLFALPWVGALILYRFNK